MELVTYEQKKTILPQLVQKAIAQNITNRQNSIIWVQKTGYSVALGCSDCGFYYSCSDCDVALRFYRKERILRCPRCGKKVIPESFCPECHGPVSYTHLDVYKRQGFDVILEIDVQGALQVKRNYPQGIFVFIAPPSLETLGERLRNRKTDREDVIYLRMMNALIEMKSIQDYDYLIINNVLKETVHKFHSVIIAERCRIRYGDDETPVSYTHLDVYKRQDYPVPSHLFESDYFSSNQIFIENLHPG